MISPSDPNFVFYVLFSIEFGKILGHLLCGLYDLIVWIYRKYKSKKLFKEKEAVIAKYSKLLDEEELNSFKERMDEFTKEELDKELAFVLVQSRSTIFTNNEDGFLPKPDENLTGIEAILTRQKNKKK